MKTSNIVKRLLAFLLSFIRLFLPQDHWRPFNFRGSRHAPLPENLQAYLKSYKLSEEEERLYLKEKLAVISQNLLSILRKVLQELESADEIPKEVITTAIEQEGFLTRIELHGAIRLHFFAEHIT
jgi:hypothetical protein